MLEDDADPESIREVAAEDFLFHLYRGSELLQDDRVQEAKEELEHALGLQPRDPKGQDLLAIVYFRLGLYPRAIAIYEQLIGGYPEATTPRINLALCYLKTGQPARARTELERVIQREPGHARAWGYLGLAFQRLGDAERAIAAFQAGGHEHMAQRLAELREPPPAPATAPQRGLSSPEREVVSRIGSEAFEALDQPNDAGFRADHHSQPRAVTGTWAAVEPGRESVPSDRRSVLPVGLATVTPSESLPPPGFGPSVAPASNSRPPPSGPHIDVPLASAHGPLSVPRIGPLRGPSLVSAPPLPFTTAPSTPPSSSTPPANIHALARDNLLVFPRDHATSLHTSGCVLIQAGAGVAARFDVLRAMSFQADPRTRPLQRRFKGRDVDEPLGSASAPLLAVEGSGQLVLGPPPGMKLVAIALAEELLHVRESSLVAIEGDVQYENVRLPGGDGDFVSMVNLRGRGTATIALPLHWTTLEIEESRTVIVRVHAVLGWIGRVSARALAPSEAPTKARGLVSLTGEGMVLLDGR